MDIQQYLGRINYAGDLTLTPETLSALQRAHLMHVPFENLDVHSHVKIDLSDLFNKIVIRKRGGFCYELNGLFYQLLKAIGFRVKMISARVYNSKEEYGREFDHMAIIASIGGDNYLVDVGFGDFALFPLKIETGKATTDPAGVFRIKVYNDKYRVVEKKNEDGRFIPEYKFSETERRIEEFYRMCHYHQTSKESHFTQKRICSLPTENGRITLTGNTLKVTSYGTVTSRALNNEEEISQVLLHHFGIKL